MNKNALVNSIYQSVNQNKSRKRIIEVQDRDVVTSANSGDGTVLTAVCFSVCEQSRITITRRPASADRTARAANFRRAGLIGDVGL